MFSLTSRVSLFILIVVIWKWTVFSVEAADDMETSTTKWQSNTISERNKYMYNNSFMSDIKLTFGNNQSGEVFYAHKYVLATGSPVFYEIFYSKSGKNITNIYLHNFDNLTIAAFLHFLYEDECPTPLNAGKGLKILRLVMKYQVTSFNTACKNYLKPQITPQDAFKLVEEFLELKAERFVNICLDNIDTRASEYFTSEYFLNTKLSTLNVLLQRDTLDYSEAELFKAVLRWVDHRCSQENLKATGENRRIILGDTIYSIRFLAMTLSEFATEVITTDILSNHESVTIIKAMVGHPVPDMKWNSSRLRRERRRKAWNSWTYFFAKVVGTLIFIFCSLFCISALAERANSKASHQSNTQTSDSHQFPQFQQAWTRIDQHQQREPHRKQRHQKRQQQVDGRNWRVIED